MKKSLSNIKRDTPDERVLFGRLWRGTFQAVFAERNSRYRRALQARNGMRSGSHDEISSLRRSPFAGNSNDSIPSRMYHDGINDDSALCDDSSCIDREIGNILSNMRRSCCCHCMCNPSTSLPVATDDELNKLQVYLTNSRHKKHAMRSVIRWLHQLIYN